MCGGYLQPHALKKSMKTHPLNHRNIGGEKEINAWLHVILTALYIKQFNETHLLKQRYDRGKDLWWLLTALYKTIQ